MDNDTNAILSYWMSRLSFQNKWIIDVHSYAATPQMKKKMNAQEGDLQQNYNKVWQTFVIILCNPGDIHFLSLHKRGHVIKWRCTSPINQKQHVPNVFHNRSLSYRKGSEFNPRDWSNIHTRLHGEENHTQVMVQQSGSILQLLKPRA